MEVAPAGQDVGGNDNTWADVIAEVSILCRLDHPNIISLREFFIQSNKVYLVTNLVKGASLPSHVQSLHVLATPASGHSHAREAIVPQTCRTFLAASIYWGAIKCKSYERNLKCEGVNCGVNCHLLCRGGATRGSSAEGILQRIYSTCMYPAVTRGREILPLTRCCAS